MVKRLLRCRRGWMLAILISACQLTLAGNRYDLFQKDQDQQKSDKQKDKTLLQLLKEIHKTYKVDLLYEARKLPNVKVNFNPADYRKIDEMLKALLAPLGLDAQSVQPNTWAIIPVEDKSARIHAPEAGKGAYHNTPAELVALNKNSGTAFSGIGDTMRYVKIRGRVLDETNDALPGTNILIKGENKGTYANGDGSFLIETSIGKTLAVSLIGYDPKEVLVTGDRPVELVLKASNKALSEIVVVGYGTQRKSQVTTAISSVKAAEIATVSSSRIEQALQGRTAGVNVLPASGSPGSAMRVRIRGTGSNGAAEPLFIVDGMRAGGIEYLDPSEIAAIEVLKDAASAAIYGAEGANGVVMVTTKTGRRDGTTVINYSTQFGQQSIKSPMPLMNVMQYGSYLQAANTDNRPTGEEISEAGYGTNWMEQILQTAPMQRHALSFSGGTEKSSYLIGGTFFSQNGVVGGDKAQFDRYTFRINTDHQVKPWLTIGNRLSYAHFSRKGVTEDSEFGGVINNAILFDPLTPPLYTGTLPLHAKSALEKGLPLVRNGAGQYYGISRYVFGEIGNPLAQMNITHNNTAQNKVVGNVYADIEPVKNVKITSRFGVDAAFQRNHGWNPTFWYSSERLNTVAGVFDQNENFMNWQWENFATYHKMIRAHDFTALLGMSSIKHMYNRLNGTSSGMLKEEDKFGFHDFTQDDNDRIGGVQNATTLVSYYGRLSYGYMERYLLSITVRRDGASILPPNNQWATFPSVSAGWVISNEPFFLHLPVDYLKLRASWGRNGSLSNLAIGQWASLVTTQGLRYPDANGNFITAAEPDGLANPDLKWESSEQIDVGLDMAILQNRLNLTVDYYRKTTRDLITPGTAPNPVGNPLRFVNGGNVENQGVELELSYKNEDHEFKYEVAGNLATVKNKVTYLNPNINRINGTMVGTGWTATFFEKDQPIWYFRGYKTNGIFQDQAEIDDYLGKGRITGYSPKPGDPIVVDVNNDGKITPDDQTYIGSPHPKLIYGARVNLAYKGFDLIFFIQGQSGNDILMGFNRVDRATGNRPAFFYEDRWTGPGSTNKWFAPNTSSPFIYNSDLMVFNGSYARIRQLQLGYTLPNELMRKLKVRNARVYVSLDDFFTFTRYPGMDPEAGSVNNNSLGVDRGVYPIPRKLLGGLSFSF